jgi:putative ABC transport system substrate-binding protein
MAIVAPLPADGQQAWKGVRVGYLGGPPSFDDTLFRKSLHELGWVEGQNIAIEYRGVMGRVERLPELLAELIRLQVDIIYTPGSIAAALAAKQATTTIPVVFTTPADPVEAGLVPSLARPGGNITGLAGVDVHPSKYLELLMETIPKLSRVAVIWNPANPLHPRGLKWTEDAARALGVQLQPWAVRDADELDGAFSAMTRGRVGALFVFGDRMFYDRRTRIVALAAKHRLPAIYIWRAAAMDGGLMSYGADRSDWPRRAALYVDKILKGAKPGDLPVEQPTKFELVINLKTAKTLGLKIPQAILIRADEVIQ